MSNQGNRVYVGNLDTRITERDLEVDVWLVTTFAVNLSLSGHMRLSGFTSVSWLQDEFVRFGTLRSVWVARKPPGFGASVPCPRSTWPEEFNTLPELVEEGLH